MSLGRSFLLLLVVAPTTVLMAQDATSNLQDVQLLSDKIDQLQQSLGQQSAADQHGFLEYLASHDWVDPATFYFVLALTAYGVYQLSRARIARRYEYVTYVLNIPLRCTDGRPVEPHSDVFATHGLITGILREDQFSAAFDRQQLAQLDRSIRQATPEGFLPLDHDMFAMFRTEISEIYSESLMRFERIANDYEHVRFREMYFSVMYEGYTDRKHVRILILPKDRLGDLPDPEQDRTTILRSRKLMSRLKNLRFMRDEMERVKDIGVDDDPELSAYVRTFQIMDLSSLE